MRMQLPGLDELETSVGRAVEKLAALREENTRLAQSLRELGKEIDGLAGVVKEIKSGQKMDARTKKRLEAKLRALVDKLGQ